MSTKRILGVMLGVGLCATINSSAWGQALTANDQFLRQIEKNRNQFQDKMFKENQGSIASTDTFAKQLKSFQTDLNKSQQNNVLQSNSLSSDLNKIRGDFQKKMFEANQKQMMKSSKLQERIAQYQKGMNKGTQESITKGNQAGLSGDLGGFLNKFQDDMFKKNMKNFQGSMFSGTVPAPEVDVNGQKAKK